MTDSLHANEHCFRYLQVRSHLRAPYRRWLLCPRPSRPLTGRRLGIGCGIGEMSAHRAGTVGVDVYPRNKVYYGARSLADTVRASGVEWLEVFHTAWIRSEWMAHKLRQYCVFGQFRRGA